MLRRRGQDGTPTIMELYRQDVLSRLQDGRRITQCALLPRETSPGANAADRLSVSDVSDEDARALVFFAKRRLETLVLPPTDLGRKPRQIAFDRLAPRCQQY